MSYKAENWHADNMSNILRQEEYSTIIYLSLSRKEYKEFIWKIIFSITSHIALHRGHKLILKSYNSCWFSLNKSPDGFVVQNFEDEKGEEIAHMLREDLKNLSRFL